MVFVNSDFENKNVEIVLPQKWEKKIKQITSYRTDARHDLTASTLGKSMKTNIAPRGVTTLVIDF